MSSEEAGDEGKEKLSSTKFSSFSREIDKNPAKFIGIN